MSKGTLSLDNRQVYSVIEMVGDRGWVVFSARVNTRIEVLKKALLDPSDKRKGELPDDYIRGQIEALEWTLHWPTFLAEQRLELETEERQERRRRESVDLLARVGPTFPGASSRLSEV